MKAYWMILAVFFLCTGFGTSWDNYQTTNFRGLASTENNVKMEELEATICEQNLQISSLESKIEELIANSEETLSAATKEKNKDKDKKEEENEETPSTQLVITDQIQDTSMSTMLMLMLQQQASQMTMFQATMAEIQSTQTAILSSQGRMADLWSNTFSKPLLEYSQYPSIYNFGNSYSFNNGTIPSHQDSILDINRFPSADIFHGIPLRQSHLNRYLLNPEHMYHFLPEPKLPVQKKENTLPKTTEV